MTVHRRLSKRATHPSTLTALALIPAAVLIGCGGSSDNGPPQLAAATPGTLKSCAALASSINFPNTSITAAAPVDAGVLKVAGKDIPAHCQVTGKMFDRVSPVDGKKYAIGFEMRLPNDWNGRFFYQGNGGIDGSVVTATGAVNGGAGLNNALKMGFAVISSDAGHTGDMGPNFGIDPQARLDYGYQAVAKLTPMAKSTIKTAYGKEPDRSYFGGCSNGGRHTMVAASRFADQYDGYLVGNPGFNLPMAAISSIASAQVYASLASKPGDLSTGFTLAERQLVSNAVLGKCDALDGAKDGLVQDTAACQAAFNLDRDVPSCTGERDGSCLSPDQKKGLAKIFGGHTTPKGAKVYTSFPLDAGLAGGGYAFWEFTAPVALDSGGVGLIWSAPPEDAASFNGPVFALTGDIDSMLTRVTATTALYPESAMSFMTPRNPSDLSAVKARGAKMMLYHGTSDPIFSSDDTTAWYQALRKANNGDASDFARYYPVAGMNHCSGGPATDQFDMLTPLVNWVEKGQAPDAVIASARGAGNAAGANADIPASWSANRTRPLCAYPQVARYNGTGDMESASSFSCK
jgi:poly(3-hydroxybutyrate) depolymerase